MIEINVRVTHDEVEVTGTVPIDGSSAARVGEGGSPYLERVAPGQEEGVMRTGWWVDWLKAGHLDSLLCPTGHSATQVPHG